MLSESQNYTYDIFISYAHGDDSAFAEMLANWLKNQGLEVWFDEWSIATGENITAAMSKGLAQSRKVLLVMSPTYFEKEWTRVEAYSAFNESIERAQRVLIPVLRKTCPIDIVLKNLKYLDFRNDTLFEKKCQALLEVLKNRSKEAVATSETEIPKQVQPNNTTSTIITEAGRTPPALSTDTDKTKLPKHLSPLDSDVTGQTATGKAPKEVKPKKSKKDTEKEKMGKTTPKDDNVGWSFKRKEILLGGAILLIIAIVQTAHIWVNYFNKPPEFVLSYPIISSGRDTVFVVGQGAASNRKDPLDVDYDNLTFGKAGQYIPNTKPSKWYFTLLGMGITTDLIHDGDHKVRFHLPNGKWSDSLFLKINSQKKGLPTDSASRDTLKSRKSSQFTQMDTTNSDTAIMDKYRGGLTTVPSTLVVKVIAGGTYPTIRERYGDLATNILRVFHEGSSRAQLDSISKFLTLRGREKLWEVFHTGSAKVEANSINAVISYNDELIEVLSIPIRFPNVESLVFLVLVFKDGKLDSLEYDQTKFLEQLASAIELLPPNSRETLNIKGFLKDLESAYNRRKLSILDAAFADTAKIRVGRDLNMRGNNNRPEDVDYYTRTKREYMDHLQIIFENSNSLSVHFDSIEVKSIDPIQGKKFLAAWHQKWDSQNYRDNGWISAHIEMHDTKGLIIERSWRYNDRPFKRTGMSQRYSSK